LIEPATEHPVYISKRGVCACVYRKINKIMIQSRKKTFVGSDNMKNTHMEEIKRLSEIIRPVAIKYGVEAVYVFGSFARNEANEKSDYDFYINKGNIKNLFQLSAFRMELEDILQKNIDIVTEKVRDLRLKQEIEKDKVLLYEAS
jgi:predicted nucleotidyltransferase